jgi:hypothetical protein
VKIHKSKKKFGITLHATHLNNSKTIKGYCQHDHEDLRIDVESSAEKQISVPNLVT